MNTEDKKSYEPQNELERIVMAFPEKITGNDAEIVENPNCSWEFFKKLEVGGIEGVDYDNVIFNRRGYSSNPNVNIDILNEIVCGDEEDDWNWRHISYFPNGITYEVMKEHYSNPWEVRGPIFQHKNVSMEDMLKLGWETDRELEERNIDAHVMYNSVVTDEKFDPDHIYLNPNLTVEFMDENPEHIPTHDLSINKNITEEFVARHIDTIARDSAFDIYNLMRHPNISLKFAASCEALKDSIDVFAWATNPNATLNDIIHGNEYIEGYKPIPEDEEISYADVLRFGNPDTAWAFVKYMITHGHRFRIDYSNDVVVDFEFIKAHPDGAWYFKELIGNPGITMDDIENNIEFWKERVDFEDYLTCLSLSKNPNLTLEFIQNHPEVQWNWGYICKNTFGFNEMRQLREHRDFVKDIFTSIEREGSASIPRDVVEHVVSKYL